MKYSIFLLIALTIATVTNAQNAGFGTTSPAFPLSFANFYGDKPANAALFSMLDVQYGSNGITNFAIQDLRGATPVGFGTPSGGGNTPTAGE